jgi:ABC-2 type transport system permease protein
MTDQSGGTIQSAAPLRASGPGGSIYDLGYQGYTGQRLGRGHALRALFFHTIRSCFGIGRGGRAKIAPLTLGAIALIPAVLGVGIAALAKQAGELGSIVEEASPINYAGYYELVATMLLLFCAVQAPELLGRDQRFGVLPVYFSRALERIDYAVAKVLGLFASLLVVILLPYFVLFAGRVFVADSPVDGLTEELPNLLPILATGILSAGLLGMLSMVISAFTPRRAYATVGVIAAFTIPAVIVGILYEPLVRNGLEALVLLSPPEVLGGINATMFGRAADPFEEVIQLPALVYVAAALVWIGVALGLTIRRYQKITA